MKQLLVLLLAGSVSAGTFPNRFTTNADPQLINGNTLTNLQGSNVVGAVALATNSINSTNFWGVLSPTNLPPGLATSNYVGTHVGDGSGLTNLPGSNVVGSVTSAISATTAVRATYVTTQILTNNIVSSNLIGNISATLLQQSLSASGFGISAQDSFDDYPTGTILSGSISNGYGWYAAASVSNAIIGSQTFNDATVDHYLAITNGYYSRQLVVSNNWRYLRIGMLFAVAPNSTANINGCLLTVGMKSSNGAGYEGFTTASVSNWLGFVSAANNTNGQVLQYNANSGFPYYSLQNDAGLYINVRSGFATNKSAAASVSHLTTPASVAPLRRAALAVYVDRTTSGGQFFGQGIIGCNNTASIQEDFDAMRLNKLMLLGRTITLDENYLSASTLITSLTTAETQGNLDSVNIWWNNPTNAIHIYNVSVRAFY